MTKSKKGFAEANRLHGFSNDTSDQKYPDVVDAELEPTGRTWSLELTISSPYDSPERYAGGWRVLSPDGTVLDKHQLFHDHAGEQPLIRTQAGLEIPKDVDSASSTTATFASR